MNLPPAVIVVGSVNRDLVALVPRLPSPGETVGDGRFVETLGGKGANQAAAAARLGARTWLVGAVGNDANGAAARADLASLGVDVSHVQTLASPTGVALVLVDENGENLIAVAPGANHDVTSDQVVAAFDLIDIDRAVVLACLELADDAVAAAARCATTRGFPFILNPAPARPVAAEVVAVCTVMTPNEGEAEIVDGRGASSVVVTRGVRGVDVYASGEHLSHHDACVVETIDSTGAGDAFNGTLAWALADGRTLDDAVRLAVVGGALATRGLGARASLADRHELDALVAATPAHGAARS